jgi:hypothetical protein
MMYTVVCNSIREAIGALETADENTTVLDPNGDEIFDGGNGAVIYADGASARHYGPLSD